MADGASVVDAAPSSSFEQETRTATSRLASAAEIALRALPAIQGAEGGGDIAATVRDAWRPTAAPGGVGAARYRGVVADSTFPVTGHDEADRLLVTDPLALLIGMLLDQQIPMEKAFHSPLLLAERLGGPLDAAAIATADADHLFAVFRGPPALHRFPRAMAERTQAMCAQLVEHHDGRAAEVWEGAADGDELLGRLRALPGFGADKARIFIALLAKRIDVRPPGWEAAAGPFADGTRLSVADVDSRAAFDRVRAWKREQKAKAKGEAART